MTHPSGERGEIDIAGIEARLEAATPGEWQPWQTPETGWVVRARYEYLGKRHTAFIAVCHCGAQPNQENANFIAHAPTDIRALLSHVKALEAKLSDATRERDEARAQLAVTAHLTQFMHVMSPAIGLARMALQKDAPTEALGYLDRANDEMDAWELARNPRLIELSPHMADGAERHKQRLSALQSKGQSQ